MNTAISILNTETITGMASGSKIILGKIIGRKGCSIAVAGNDILLGGNGLYQFNAVLTVPEQRSIKIKVYADGQPAPFYATGKETIPISFIIDSSNHRKISFHMEAEDGKPATVSYFAVSVFRI